jgi:dephospho-CoA kinase
MILGIAGTIGGGKGTVVDYLKTKGFGHYSSSDILKEILTERGLSHTRAHMSALADELMRNREGGILGYAHERAEKDGVTDYILEAIHRESEAAYVRSIGGKILGVDAPLKARYERTQKRADGDKDAVTFEEFVQNSEREDEGKTGSGPNIRAVLKSADALIMNDGSLEELHRKIDAALVALSA